MPHDASARVVAQLAWDFASYDIVHTHLVHADWHAFPASVRRKAAWVTTKHNHDAFRTRRTFRAVERRVNRQADLTIAISSSLASFVERTTGVAPVVVPYGYSGEPRRRACLAREGRPFRLLAVGRLVRQKGFDTAITALARLGRNRASYSLTLAGEGPERARLERLADRLGVAPRVRFTGWVPDTQELMDTHDLLIHPARWEGFGLVLLEAMGAGLPVVGSTAGAVPEVLGAAAVALVPPDRPLELAKAVEAAVADPARCSLASERGHQTVIDRLSMDRTTAQLRELYELLVDGRGS
jgi:glycosyltransferase involved in cell wall biosynthesis